MQIDSEGGAKRQYKGSFDCARQVFAKEERTRPKGKARSNTTPSQSANNTSRSSQSGNRPVKLLCDKLTRNTTYQLTYQPAY